MHKCLERSILFALVNITLCSPLAVLPSKICGIEVFTLSLCSPDAIGKWRCCCSATELLQNAYNP